MKKQNIFTKLPAGGGSEHFETLLSSDHFKLERIVSYGSATMEGEWYDQDHCEWVLLLKGSAGLHIEGDKEIHVLMQYLRQKSGCFRMNPADFCDLENPVVD
jgi:cupin 2 domain-containing protein